jgi:hypothetical protein
MDGVVEEAGRPHALIESNIEYSHERSESGMIDETKGARRS